MIYKDIEFIPCQNCCEGHVPLGENFVSHEMAMDAGDMSLEGQSMGIEWGGCSCCEGNWQACINCTEQAINELNNG